MNTNFNVISLIRFSIKPEFTPPEVVALTTRPSELLCPIAHILSISVEIKISQGDFSNLLFCYHTFNTVLFDFAKSIICTLKTRHAW